MDKLLILLKTSRPFLWIIAPLAFLTGLFYSESELSVSSMTQLVLLSFPYCLLLFGINDIYDYESDIINPRKKLIEGIKLDKKHHNLIKKYSLTSVILLIISSIFTFNTVNIILMLILIFISYYYSAQPLRLKEKPPLDSLSNGIIVFILFALGFTLNKSLYEIPLKVYLIALSISGIHSFSTIMDYSVDKKARYRTFATVFGKRCAAIYSLITFVLALIFAGISTKITNYYLVFCSMLFLIISIFPSEKLASLFFKFIFIGSIITAIVLLSAIA